MAILEVLEYPNPRLREKSLPVKEVSSKLQKFIDDMISTMYEYKGIGLAAPQVGVLSRIIVIDVLQDENGKNGKPVAYINPKITWHSEDLVEYREGCLSLPDQFYEVERFAEIKVSYMDYNGVEQVLHAEGILSIVLQHETDHLNGILFSDHISRLKRNILLKRLTKFQKERCEQI